VQRQPTQRCSIFSGAPATGPVRRSGRSCQDGHTSTPTDRRAHASCPSPILPGAAVLDPLALLALLASPCFRLARKMAPDATQFNDAMAAAGLDADRSAALAKIWQKKVSTPQAAHSCPRCASGGAAGGRPPRSVR
jgi:hypothetical protein